MLARVGLSVATVKTPEVCCPIAADPEPLLPQPDRTRIAKSETNTPRVFEFRIASLLHRGSIIAECRTPSSAASGRTRQPEKSCEVLGGARSGAGGGKTAQVLVLIAHAQDSF